MHINTAGCLPNDTATMRVWEYQDATGVMRRGVMVGSVDHGGNDVSTHFRRLDDNRLDIVSGSRLRSIAAVES